MSHTDTLAENRYDCKRYAAKPTFGHVSGMPRHGKQKPRKPPKTEVHALLARRIEEEMDRRGLNANKMKKYGGVQRTIWDLLNAGSDPRLSTIVKIATALGGMKPADLLREGPERRIVIPLHPPNPPMIPAAPNNPDKRDRKKARR